MKKLLRLKASPEIELLLSCLHFHHREYYQPNILKNLTNRINWTRFYHLTQIHSVQPIVWLNLNQIKEKSIPASLLYKLHEDYHTTTQTNFLLLSELNRIALAFGIANLAYIALKGPLLGYKIFKNYNLRKSIDLDILISDNDIENAHHILIELGYKRIFPDFALNKNQQREFYKIYHTYNYRHSTNNLIIELHWRLFNDSKLFPIQFQELQRYINPVYLGEKEINIFDTEFLFLFLGVHGAKHGWSSIKWILDLTEIIKKDTQINWLKILDISTEYNLDRILGQTLLLCHSLFNLKIPESLQSTRILSSHAHQLAKKSLNFIQYHTFPSDIAMSLFVNMIYLMDLKKGIAYKSHILFNLRTDYRNWKILRLPNSLFFLYYILQFFLGVWRRCVLKHHN